MLLNPGQAIGRTRHARIVNEVAPLVARGCTTDEIASKLNYSRQMAAKDQALCHRYWAEAAAETSEHWRGTIIARHELLYREALKGWFESKQNSRPNAKLLDVACNQLDRLSRLLGLAIDVNLIQNNLTLGAANDTAMALAPLDVETYAEILKAGSLGQLNNVPPVASKAP